MRYERTGEYRTVKAGEWYEAQSGAPVECGVGPNADRWILRAIEDAPKPQPEPQLPAGPVQAGDEVVSVDAAQLKLIVLAVCEHRLTFTDGTSDIAKCYRLVSRPPLRPGDVIRIDGKVCWLRRTAGGWWLFSSGDWHTPCDIETLQARHQRGEVVRLYCGEA